MAGKLSAGNEPELIFGISGAVGVNIEKITSSLSEALRSVDYKEVPIRLTQEMYSFGPSEDKSIGSDFVSQTNYKMTYANDLRRNANDTAFFGRIAVGAIIKNRIVLSGSDRLPAAKHAYVIRQLKRPEEVNLLRRVYGKNFILISAFASVESRKNLISELLKSSLPRSTSPSALNNLVDKLIERDESENKDNFGQQLRETFHHADVFIDANSTAGSLDKISRFINAFFGQTDISPSKDEYGMYAAKGASLRSADLSRQVGAAIFSSLDNS